MTNFGQHFRHLRAPTMKLYDINLNKINMMIVFDLVINIYKNNENGPWSFRKEKNKNISFKSKFI